MLSSIIINNVLLIERAEVNFCSGFNVFTGETGAGKSILIDCIKSFCGEKNSRKLEVKDNTKDGSVVIMFDLLNDKDLVNYIKDLGINIDENESLFIKKLIKPNGNSRYSIMDQPVAGSTVASLMSRLLEIDGQFASSKLNSKDYVYNCIEKYSKDKFFFVKMRELYESVTMKQINLHEIKSNLEKDIKELPKLKEEIDEIESLKIQPNEEVKLLEERNKYKDSDFISGKISSILEDMTGNSMHSLKKADVNLMKLSSSLEGDMAANVSKMQEKLESAMVEIEEISESLSEELNELSFAKEKMEEISMRLYEIRTVCEKHSCDFGKLLEVLSEKRLKLERIESSESIIMDMEKELNETIAEYLECAKKVSELRCESINRFNLEVKNELLDLGFNSPTFEIKQDIKSGRIAVNGLDDLEIKTSFNKGVEAKKVSKSASGGEMSRLMLAMRAVISKFMQVKTVIFDEIDTGVSGQVSDKIGLKKREISRSMQVISVTHSHQIAACADAHWCIKKNSSDKTVSSVVQLNTNEERVRALADILSNGAIDEHALRLAEELLKSRQ